MAKNLMQTLIKRFTMGKKNEPIDQQNPSNQEALDKEMETPSAEETTGNPEQADSPAVAELAAQVAELKDKYLRLFAEFENYKRRTAKEKLDMIGSAAKNTIVNFLPVLDDFERAKAAADQENSTEVFSEGVELVYQKFLQTLKNQGLKRIETENATFDAEYHEAITEIPAPTEEMKGKVIDTLEQGYFLQDKVIRYAKVVVGK
jgi:molecular chaperone GrpE